ncbi:MAG: hypothetical protein K8R69_03105, partial [Deltaproteobacteria bacterium]|nr:hypothetical protein [Deltaproteobacteria bacterium]
MPALQRPTFFAESVQGQVLQQALAFPRNSPFYLSVFFRSTRDQSSPYLIRTDVFPRLPVNDASLGYPYDVESARYPLIHELSENLRLVEGNFNDLKEKEKELQRSVEKLTEWTLKSETERGPESTIEGEKRKIKRILKDMRRVLDGMDAPVKTLERWALQDGKDKAVSREAALDMVFGLYRANEAVAKNYPPAEVDAGYEVIRKTRERRYLKGSLDGLSFGVAVVDLNVTGPNSVNRDLGEIVLDQTYEALKAHFQGSVVSKGTRTNFRIVNPDGQKLSQEELLQLESDIHRRISKKVEGNPTWKAFIEGYHVGLSSGYAEVSFLPEEIRVGPQGEYEMESVNALLKKVDYGFRVAHARSQEITLKLKEEEAQ